MIEALIHRFFTPKPAVKVEPDSWEVRAARQKASFEYRHPALNKYWRILWKTTVFFAMIGFTFTGIIGGVGAFMTGQPILGCIGVLAFLTGIAGFFYMMEEWL